MKEVETIIFDFDGTLVSKDTGYEFNKWLIQRSSLRIFWAILVLPFAVPLIFISITRKFGLNIFCYVATAFQGKSLFYLREQFIRYYFKKAGATFYAEGIDELKNHQLNGKSVVIISGCPQWLLYGVVKHIGITRVTIIGSQFKIKNGALLLSEHCFKENKIKMAESVGLNLKNWAVGYSDNESDIPLLNACKKKI